MSPEGDAFETFFQKTNEEEATGSGGGKIRNVPRGIC